MKYKVVGYQGSDIYYVVCQQVQQSVYCSHALRLNQEYEGTLDYTRMVDGYPTFCLNGLEAGLMRRHIGKGL